MASKKVKIGEVQNKLLDTTTTTTDLNKRLWRLKTKYQILIVWLRKQIITLKCKKLRKQCFTTSGYSKSTCKKILDANIKRQD